MYCVLFAMLGEREIGQPGVLTGDGPRGFAMAREIEDLQAHISVSAEYHNELSVLYQGTIFTRADKPLYSLLPF